MYPQCHEDDLVHNEGLGALAYQKATLPAVCIKTTIKGGKEEAWAGHMEWALRGKRSCDVGFSELSSQGSRPQLTHGLTNY